MLAGGCSMINLMCSEGSHSCGSGGFLWQREENITVIFSGPREEYARFAHMDTIYNHSPSLLKCRSTVLQQDSMLDADA